MSYNYEDRVRPDILRMLPPDGQRIGSVGCGTAALEQILVRQGREVHGVDVSAEAIDIARTRLTSARVVSPDERRPFEEGSLDGLILADVIEHLPVAWERLADYARMVRPGGWVLISAPNHRSVKVLWRFVLCGDWPEQPMGLFDSTHVQVMTRRRLQRWCRLAGLRIERWFDTYLSQGWKQSLLRAADALTLRLLHDWWLLQLQLIARRLPL